MADFSTVARPYAKAIFELASEADALGAWAEGLAAAAAVMRDDDARRHLGRPEIRAAERAEFLASVLAGMPEAVVFAQDDGRNLLKLLSENDRLAILPEIATQFEALKTLAENKIKVTLVSASAVDEQQAATVVAALERKLGRQVELELEVDPALLGGAVIRAQDMVIDASVKSRLRRLAGALVD
jgi:F-type H+-transporting ATPase subunit delta